MAGAGAVREIVTITDLTRMSGNLVCLAGCLPDGRWVRPLFRFGSRHPDEPWLYQGAGVAIRPFAAVEMRFFEQPADLLPPHTEDWLVDRAYARRHDLDPVERHELLSGSAAPSVDLAFGATVEGDGEGWGRWVMAGGGERSLATVRVGAVRGVLFGVGPHGKREYRLRFEDETGAPFRLMVTDLAFRYRLDALVDRDGLSYPAAARALLDRLQTPDVFLRVGLARRWAKHPDRCYLQVNGVYPFPDYLDGRCFADFVDDPGREVPF